MTWANWGRISPRDTKTIYLTRVITDLLTCVLERAIILHEDTPLPYSGSAARQLENHVSCGRILKGRTDFRMENSVKPVEITDANFNAEIGDFPGVAVVDFWAAWCGPCRMQGPIVDKLAEEYRDGVVKVAKLNVDDNPQAAAKFGIQSIPTLIIFKDGKPVDKAVGVTPLAALKRRVEQVMSV